MPITTFLSNRLLDHQTGKAAYAMPTVYVGLSSTLPTIAGTNVTEPSGGAYGRVITSAASWESAASQAITTAAALTFPTATADWLAGANLTHGVLFDAASGGNLLAWGNLAVAKDILNGDTATIPAGDLDITLT